MRKIVAQIETKINSLATNLSKKKKGEFQVKEMKTINKKIFSKEKITMLNSKNNKKHLNDLTKGDVELRQLFNIVSKYLEFLKTERDNIVHHSKKLNKLHEKVKKEHSKILFSSSVIVGDPTSLKELKSINKIQQILQLRYVYCKTIRQIACFINMNYNWFFIKYKRIL